MWTLYEIIASVFITAALLVLGHPLAMRVPRRPLNLRVVAVSWNLAVELVLFENWRQRQPRRRPHDSAVA